MCIYCIVYVHTILVSFSMILCRVISVSADSLLSGTSMYVCTYIHIRTRNFEEDSRYKTLPDLTEKLQRERETRCRA